MTIESGGAVSGSGAVAPPEFTEYLVRRDAEPPLAFAGACLAKASRPGGIGGHGAMLDAAIYRTRGGKYITTLAKHPPTPLENFYGTIEDITGPGGGYNKAAVHESFEAAIAWFRPGRLTDDIRRQLGLDQPIRIE